MLTFIFDRSSHYKVFEVDDLLDNNKNDFTSTLVCLVQHKAAREIGNETRQDEMSNLFGKNVIKPCFVIIEF